MKQEINDLVEFIMERPVCNLVIKRVNDELLELILADDMALDVVQGPSMLIHANGKPEYCFFDGYGNQVGSYWGRIRINTIEQFRVLCKAFDTYGVDRMYLPETIKEWEREEYLASEFVYVHPYLYAALKEDLFTCTKKARMQMQCVSQMSEYLSIPANVLFLYKGQVKAYEDLLIKSGYMDEYLNFEEHLDDETVKEEFEEVKDHLLDDLTMMGILEHKMNN